MCPPAAAASPGGAAGAAGGGPDPPWPGGAPGGPAPRGGAEPGPEPGPPAGGEPPRGLPVIEFAEMLFDEPAAKRAPWPYSGGPGAAEEAGPGASVPGGPGVVGGGLYPEPAAPAGDAAPPSPDSRGARRGAGQGTPAVLLLSERAKAGACAGTAADEPGGGSPRGSGEPGDGAKPGKDRESGGGGRDSSKGGAGAPDSGAGAPGGAPDGDGAQPGAPRFLPLRAPPGLSASLARTQSLPVLSSLSAGSGAGELGVTVTFTDAPFPAAHRAGRAPGGAPGDAQNPAPIPLSSLSPAAPAATPTAAPGRRLFDFSHTPVSVPWMPDFSGVSAADSWLRRLNLELERYVAFTTLRPEEARARRELVVDIERVVTTLYPGSYVASYGSFDTGLSGYWADVDIEVFFPPQAAGVRAGRYPQHSQAPAAAPETPDLLTRMRRIGAALRETISAGQLEVRDRARVPIISGTDDQTGLEFDIGFGSTTGLANAREVQRYCRGRPEARILIMVVKAFLRQRQLHQPFTGGMSGHMVFQLVRAYLDERPVLFPYPQRPDVLFAQALLEFLEFYGTLFNFREIGLCADGDARRSYFFLRASSKAFRRAVRARGKAAVISLLDPLCKDNDIGLGAFNWPTIQHRLAGAYFSLLRAGGVCGPPGAREGRAATWVTPRERRELERAGGSAPGSPGAPVACSILSAIVLPDLQGLLVRDRCLRLYGEGGGRAGAAEAPGASQAAEGADSANGGAQGPNGPAGEQTA